MWRPSDFRSNEICSIFIWRPEQITSRGEKKNENSFPTHSFNFIQCEQNIHILCIDSLRTSSPSTTTINNNNEKIKTQKMNVKWEWEWKKKLSSGNADEIIRGTKWVNWNFRNLLRMRGQTFARIFFCNYYFGSPHSNFYSRLITHVFPVTKTPQFVCRALNRARERNRGGHREWERVREKAKGKKLCICDTDTMNVCKNTVYPSVHRRIKYLFSPLNVVSASMFSTHH